MFGTVNGQFISSIVKHNAALQPKACSPENYSNHNMFEKWAIFRLKMLNRSSQGTSQSALATKVQMPSLATIPCFYPEKNGLRKIYTPENGGKLRLVVIKVRANPR